MNTLQEAFKSEKSRKYFFAQKVRKILHEFKHGKLKHGGTGKPIPENRRDIALAIALNSATRHVAKMDNHSRVYSRVR